MIENIIFYFACLLFALIGLGAIWKHRHDHTKIFFLIFIGTPIILGILFIGGINTLAALDIRELFTYVKEAEAQIDSRNRMILVTCIIFSIIAYLIITICLLLQTKKRIVNGTRR